MEELKVRAWDNTHKEMVYSSKEDCFYINTKGIMFMYNNPHKEEYYKSYDIMLYTERKDKNNTEIYKHDIVRLCTKSEFLDPIDWEIFEGVVKMIQGQWVIFDDKTNQPLYGFDDVEVIGNIYENPELRK